MISTDEGPRVAVRTPDGHVPLAHDDMTAFIADGAAAVEAARAAAASAPPVADAPLLAPLSCPRLALFHSINWQSLVDETAGARTPTESTFFAKLPSSVVGPEASIVKPYQECQLDYEVELAIVIGRDARGLTEENALDAVFGYTVANDISARDLQVTGITEIMRGKGLDTFCPLGPDIVLSDEIPDPSVLRLSLTVNGETRQDEGMQTALFSVPRILAAISRWITLGPGDIVTTGTPAGLGLNFSPPRWLMPGDEVVATVDRVGDLRNPVVAGW
jgi:2-keto-4-pentenoate hydratase/2-oxohepta-3-ene-1,7-dioic acid hydratase in catechol pathway